MQLKVLYKLKFQSKGKKKNEKEKNVDANEVVANDNSSNNGYKKKNYPPYHHCGKKGHHPFKCWKRLDVKCSKCNKMGHYEKIFKSNSL